MMDIINRSPLTLNDKQKEQFRIIGFQMFLKHEHDCKKRNCHVKDVMSDLGLIFMKQRDREEAKCSVCKKIPAPNSDIEEWKAWHLEHCKEVESK